MSRAIVVRRPNGFWWNLSKCLVLGFSKLWFRLRVEGRENFPAEGPVVVVANHSSYLDPPMIGISSPRWVLFLAQAGLARFAPVRWWMSQVGVTLIDRDAPSKTALRLLADSLAAGEPVAVYPEGTRSRDGKVAKFKSGVDFLVRRTNAKVLPVGIDGAYRAMNRRHWWPRPRKVVVRFGEVWQPEQLLAEGGRERLRAEVARLARAPLADAPEQNRSKDDNPSSAPVSLPSAADASDSRARQSS